MYFVHVSKLFIYLFSVCVCVRVRARARCPLQWILFSFSGFHSHPVDLFFFFFFLASYSLSGSAEHAVAMSSFTFTCNTGQAVSGITWIADTQRLKIYHTSGTSCNSDGAPANYSYTCSRGTLYTLTIPSVSFSQRGSKWRCDSRFGGSRSSELTLEVYGKKCLFLRTITTCGCSDIIYLTIK